MCMYTYVCVAYEIGMYSMYICMYLYAMGMYVHALTCVIIEWLIVGRIC